MELSKFDRCKILVVGDLMIDEYLWGVVERISPEAPVQIVSVRSEGYTLGGAGNVVNNLFSLGARVSVAGVIGSDRHGNLLLDKLKQIGVDATGVIQEKDRPTTRKTRIIANNQHVLRIDREKIKEISDQTLKTALFFLKKKIAEVDIVLISDYGKGMISAFFIAEAVAFAKKESKIIIADPKGSDFSKYSGVSLITPNKKEAAFATRVDITCEQKLFEAGNVLIDKYGFCRLLITCGKDGMILFEKKNKPYKISAQTRQVYDVSGAGDTVLAVLGLALASGESYLKSAKIANIAAGLVVGKVGTATVSRKELLDAMTHFKAC